jgi:hypothetical protein
MFKICFVHCSYLNQLYKNMFPVKLSQLPLKFQCKEKWLKIETLLHIFFKSNWDRPSFTKDCMCNYSYIFKRNSFKFCMLGYLLPYGELQIDTIFWLDHFGRSYCPFWLRIFHQNGLIDFGFYAIILFFDKG